MNDPQLLYLNSQYLITDIPQGTTIGYAKSKEPSQALPITYKDNKAVYKLPDGEVSFFEAQDENIPYILSFYNLVYDDTCEINEGCLATLAMLGNLPPSVAQAQLEATQIILFSIENQLNSHFTRGCLAALRIDPKQRELNIQVGLFEDERDDGAFEIYPFNQVLLEKISSYPTHVGRVKLRMADAILYLATDYYNSEQLATLLKDLPKA